MKALSICFYVNRFHTLYGKKIVLGVKVSFMVCLNCSINRLQSLHRFLCIKIKRSDWKAACLIAFILRLLHV